MTVALTRVLPELAALPWAPLAELPTPVERLAALEARTGGGPLYVKRDDLTGSVYGGNKVRTLEPLFGEARALGRTRVWSTGVYGSNHALATAAHARAAGLEAGAIYFTHGPVTADHEANTAAMIAFGCRMRRIAHWALLPLAMWREARVPGSYVMTPGGATPTGALGFTAAALELARQVEEGQLEAPRRVLIGLGSTCSAAGLLAGFALARRLGHAVDPEVWGVRVTPWPVTARFRVVSLAARALALVSRHAGRDLRVARGALGAGLVVIGDQLGRGYAYETPAGLEAMSRFVDAGGPGLDATYSGKVAAALLARPMSGPSVFWATKNTRVLLPA